MAPPHRNDPEDRGAGRAGFEAAYERHFDGVYRFCLSRAGNPTVAQEITQKVFTEAWKRWGDISTPARPIAPWLFTVARHMLSGQQRDRRRKEDLVRTLGEVQPGYADDPCDELVRTHTARALIGSLRSLPPGQRQVVGLCLIDECSYEAAAAALHIPVGTVRSRLSRARMHLALAVRRANGF
jgi:RNA polymerase sigma factor (sigma-70 family)